MNEHVVLLATEDTTVEEAARAVAAEGGYKLNCMASTQDAVAQLADEALDGAVRVCFAVVDLDLPGRCRTLVRTFAGVGPVIVVASGEVPWTASMIRHHQIVATVTKPVTRRSLRAAMALAHQTR